MGRRCSVESCLSDSNRPEDTGVTFHKIPTHSDIRPKWLSLCRIPDDKRDTKIIYICSRHFLNADFCNFKGRKYMLKQGVLPSVFPWSKLKKTDEKTERKAETKPAVEKAEKQPAMQSATIEQKAKTLHTPYGSMNFTINSPIEALDFNDTWSLARIVEVDYEENEVLIHFEKCSSKHDEWICMDSARLRPLQPIGEVFEVGERCMASWSDARKFPATVQKIVEKDTYEVLFDDGFLKTLKGHRMSKANPDSMQSSPLFQPAHGSKQDRRDKKRKINVAALFNKRHKPDGDKKPSKPSEPPSSPVCDDVEPWVPTWENGKPVGTDSFIETSDGTKKSVIVADPRLPEGWTKHLTQRVHGYSAGKWDTVIVSPEGRKFRARNELRAFLENHYPELKCSEGLFDFTLTSKRTKKGEGQKKVAQAAVEGSEAVEQPAADNSTEEEDNTNSLKIPLVDDMFKCPIDGCGKNFRKENLAQMHVKHYHPKYTKFLDFTPNVADLAYARTVGEALDKSPAPPKASPAKSTPKQGTSKVVSKPQSPDSENVSSPSAPPKKDFEIIKLLNSKPFEPIKREEETKTSALPGGLPSNMYPDIKLRDLLNRSEAVPRRDDFDLKNLGTHRPTGIKTLLPVVRVPENKPDAVPMDIDNTPKSHSKVLSHKQGFKRKRQPTEPLEDKLKEEVPVVPQEVQVVPEQRPGNVIIEGGEIIKIVRMKREEIINCTCGITEEDGLMIQCELCLCWQHAYCNNIERENQVPDKYICYICQNPVRQRSSMKYFHDQDWLKQGTLPTGSYHSKDEEVLNKRFEKLKKSHDISGGLMELKDYVHTLKVKIKIAGAKNHPKLYQWSKPWDKPPLPEKIDSSQDEKSEVKIKTAENGVDIKSEPQNDSVLLSMLTEVKAESKEPVEQMPNIPQPEAAIDTTECRLNLLDHIAHSQSLVEERLNEFEDQINALEDDSLQGETDEDYPKMRQTLQMLLKDLTTLKEFSQIGTI